MNLLSDPHALALLCAPTCAFFALRCALAFHATPTGATASRAVGLTAMIAFCVGLSVISAASAEQALARILVLCGLAHVALIDWRLMVAPVRLCLVLALFGLGYSWWIGGALHAGECAAASAFGWASFRLLDRFCVVVRGRSGLGAGDALIAAALGAWLSFEGLALSVAIGGAVTLFAMQAMKRTHEPFPFAPGLALGAFVVVSVNQLP